MTAVWKWVIKTTGSPSPSHQIGLSPLVSCLRLLIRYGPSYPASAQSSTWGRAMSWWQGALYMGTTGIANWRARALDLIQVCVVGVENEVRLLLCVCERERENSGWSLSRWRGERESHVEASFYCISWWCYLWEEKQERTQRRFRKHQCIMLHFGVQSSQTAIDVPCESWWFHLCECSGLFLCRACRALMLLARVAFRAGLVHESG